MQASVLSLCKIDLLIDWYLPLNINSIKVSSCAQFFLLLVT